MTDIRCLTHEIRNCTICIPPAVRYEEWIFEHGRGWILLERDGAAWLITHDIIAGGVTLQMSYRDHRLMSRHVDVDAAQRHHADMVAAFKARTMAAYAVWGNAIHNDDAQLGMEV